MSAGDTCPYLSWRRGCDKGRRGQAHQGQREWQKGSFSKETWGTVTIKRWDSTLAHLIYKQTLAPKRNRYLIAAHGGGL